MVHLVGSLHYKLGRIHRARQIVEMVHYNVFLVTTNTITCSLLYVLTTRLTYNNVLRVTTYRWYRHNSRVLVICLYCKLDIAFVGHYHDGRSLFGLTLAVGHKCLVGLFCVGCLGLGLTSTSD